VVRADESGGSLAQSIAVFGNAQKNSLKGKNYGQGWGGSCLLGNVLVPQGLEATLRQAEPVGGRGKGLGGRGSKKETGSCKRDRGGEPGPWLWSVFSPQGGFSTLTEKLHDQTGTEQGVVKKTRRVQLGETALHRGGDLRGQVAPTKNRTLWFVLKGQGGRED